MKKTVQKFIGDAIPRIPQGWDVAFWHSRRLASERQAHYSMSTVAIETICGEGNSSQAGKAENIRGKSRCAPFSSECNQGIVVRTFEFLRTSVNRQDAAQWPSHVHKQLRQRSSRSLTKPL
jgi:hypothetical protein